MSAPVSRARQIRELRIGDFYSALAEQGPEPHGIHKALSAKISLNFAIIKIKSGRFACARRVSVPDENNRGGLSRCSTTDWRMPVHICGVSENRAAAPINSANAILTQTVDMMSTLTSCASRKNKTRGKMEMNG